MNILVTGGAGFIGSHVVEWLMKRGHEITVLDNLSSGKADNLPKGVQLISGDITHEVDAVFSKGGFEAVIHLAAQVSVPASIEDPLFDQKVNIEGLLRLLEACRHYGVGSFIFASSAAVYGVPQVLPVIEAHPTVPLSPYGLTKRMSEEYLRLYHELHGLRTAVLRFGNVYGPRQPVKGESGVVAIFTDQLKRGETPVIFGDGNDTRDYVYVKDVARAVGMATESQQLGLYNVAAQSAVTLNELFEKLTSAAKRTLKPRYGPPRQGDIPHSTLSIERIQQELGWQPETTLEEGLAATIHWAFDTI